MPAIETHPHRRPAGDHPYLVVVGGVGHLSDARQLLLGGATFNRFIAAQAIDDGAHLLDQSADDGGARTRIGRDDECLDEGVLQYPEISVSTPDRNEKVVVVVMRTRLEGSAESPGRR